HGLEKMRHQAGCHLVRMKPLVGIDAVRAVHRGRRTGPAARPDAVVGRERRHLNSRRAQGALNDADRPRRPAVTWRHGGDDVENPERWHQRRASHGAQRGTMKMIIPTAIMRSTMIEPNTLVKLLSRGAPPVSTAVATATPRRPRDRRQRDSHR